jgi:hypothetical protein
MRFAALGIGMLLISAPAFAQAPCTSPPIEYDPYKPSHLAIMREYGGTILAQAPVSTLLKLDPYVPSQGELLRQLGRGIPIWTAYPWSPYGPLTVTQPHAASPDCEPPVLAPSAPITPPLTSFAEVVRRVERERGTASASAAPAITVRQTTAERNRGVLLNYAGRTWESVGAAVPLRESEFTRIGESAGFPIYRAAGTKDDVIFVPTIGGMVAPFRVRR